MVIFDVFYVRVCFFGLGHLPLKVEDWPWFGVSDDFGIVPYRRIQTLKLYCQKSLFGVYVLGPSVPLGEGGEPLLSHWCFASALVREAVSL